MLWHTSAPSVCQPRPIFVQFLSKSQWSQQSMLFGALPDFKNTLCPHAYSISSLSPDHWWACLSGMWRQLRLLGNASVEKQENLPAPPPLTEIFFWDSSRRIKILISYLFWNSWTYPWSSSSKERNQYIQLASSTIELHFPGSYLEPKGIHFTGSFLFELRHTPIFIGQGCLNCFVSQISQYAWFLQA